MPGVTQEQFPPLKAQAWVLTIVGLQLPVGTAECTRTAGVHSSRAIVSLPGGEKERVDSVASGGRTVTRRWSLGRSPSPVDHGQRTYFLYS